MYIEKPSLIFGMFYALFSFIFKRFSFTFMFFGGGKLLAKVQFLTNVLNGQSNGDSNWKRTFYHSQCLYIDTVLISLGFCILCCT